MNWTIKTFDELTGKEIYEILRSRAEVFMKEQRISYVDPDGIDYKSWHVFATENDKVCAYLRAFKDGDDTIKIGRVLTLIHGKGTGTQLMKYAISAAMQPRPLPSDKRRKGCIPVSSGWHPKMLQVPSHGMKIRAHPGLCF